MVIHIIKTAMTEPVVMILILLIRTSLRKVRRCVLTLHLGEDTMLELSIYYTPLR